MNSLKNCSDKAHALAGTRITMSKKIIVYFIFISAAALLVQSCGSSREEMESREKSGVIADSVSNYMGNLSADTIDGVAHHFIRSASLKCRMPDVLSATKQIEDLVALTGGYAATSHLSSEVNSRNSLRFAKDSLLEQSYYITTNTMTLRIPNKQLDSVLRKITDMAAFVDYRDVRSDDVKMKLYGNSLAERRLKTYTSRIEAKAVASEQKLSHALAAEDAILSKQELADAARIESHELADQVNYSTLVIELYETQKLSSQKTFIPPVVEPYEPSFGEKLGAAFSNGFLVLKKFMLFLAETWSVFFIMGLIFFFARKGVRYYNKRYAVDAK